MTPASFRLIWADKTVALVAIRMGENGKPVISVSGAGRARLLSVFDYGITAAIDAELELISRRYGGQLHRIEPTGPTA